MRRLWPLASALTGICMAVTPLRGQDTTAVEPQQMEPVVVSATRTETPLNQLGQSVTVVTRQQIEETRATDLGDLLRQVVGLDVRTNGQHSSSTAIGIRGLSGYHTKVLINGIVLQDSSSPQQMPILNDINLNDVERIEVVRGPGSTTYGANALGGVVNIITRSGQGAGRTCPDGTPNPLPTGNLGFEFGSHGRFRTSASARGQSGPVDYAVGWLRESEKGISAMDTELNEDNDAWRNQQVQGTLGLRLAPGLRLEVFGRYSSSDEEYDMGYPASMYSPATLDTGDTPQPALAERAEVGGNGPLRRPAGLLGLGLGRGPQPGLSGRGWLELQRPLPRPYQPVHLAEHRASA